MSKIKIGVIGSCVSRDGFNSQFVKDYKQFYKCVLAQNHMSMISLMANPVSFKPGKLQGDITDFNKQILMTELTKGVWDALKIQCPDYLILDFYADVYFGVREAEDSYITNKTWLFKKTPFYSTLDLKRTLNLDQNYEAYMKLWKQSVDTFMEKIKKEFPTIKIIVNKVHFTDTYISKETNELKRITDTGIFKYIDVEEINRQLDDFYRYFEENYDVYYINYDKEYHSDENHIWDLFYVHYTKDFYQDFTTKLISLILQDLYKNKGEKTALSENRSINANFLRNSTFNRGNAFWTYWQNDFKIEPPEEDCPNANILSINMRNQEKDTNRQIWSHAVEINTNGEQDYTISFDIKIDKVKEVDSLQIIFSLRTFNKIDHCFQDQSVWFENIKLHHIEGLKEGAWTRVTHTFRPKEGKFLKVGPYMKRNGRASWRNIKLEMGGKATEWIPSYKE